MEETLIQVLQEHYGLKQPVVTYLRHNENRTYKVHDEQGGSYVLRIHQSLTQSMTGIQHTYEGLIGELKMLEQLSHACSIQVQSPLRNKSGEFITFIDHEGISLKCSILTWLEGRDLDKHDVTDPANVQRLGAQLAELHSFFKQYKHESLLSRPQQGLPYNIQLINTLKKGLKLDLFTVSDVAVIEKSVHLINSRLECKGKTSDTWGLIHGDLGLGNVIVSSLGNLSFIDFGFFGPGYFLSDVAMGASMIPSKYRHLFIEGYYGQEEHITSEDLTLVEGFMLIAIIGFYAFQMDNESFYTWMHDRMPVLCNKYCIPFLSGERIFYTV
ncbi:Ser/Thr protein kinase RdoA (MazF antagonist) [Paenibacillus shirakamiensis]|uniref:Ser/Thr protein kinase RdoA (MazF antagonist) n=2 Tax=Paenibacillus shirakamiensis TaxID=1265935 RepID=A0ABS4JGR1_9BACL|nr:Ser/Thr protein kinase RdoA (MazF antagonist) [Paenibacillus shirakamiensis]